MKYKVLTKIRLLVYETAMEKEDKELAQECQETIAMLEGLKEKLKNLSPTGIGLPLEKLKKPNKLDKPDKRTHSTKPENKL